MKNKTADRLAPAETPTPIDFSKGERGVFAARYAAGPVITPEGVLRPAQAAMPDPQWDELHNVWALLPEGDHQLLLRMAHGLLHSLAPET